MKILFLVQAYPRDLHLDKKMGGHLTDFGHTVRYGSIVATARKDTLQFKPDVVVVPEARCEYVRDYVKLVRKWGCRAVIRRTEPGFTKKNPDSDEDKLHCIGNWPYEADLEIVWCEEFADILKANKNVICKNVKAAGGFAFDPYFPPPKKHRTNKPLALFVTLWDYADRRPDYCVPELPFGHPIHAEKYWLCRNGRDKWLEEIQRCVKEYPSWDFAIKVHPAEHPTEYENVFKDTNVKIYHREFACDVLPKASVLIHAGSTMAIEAHLLKIPAIQFANYSNTLVNKISPTVEKVSLKDLKLNESNANTEVIKELEQTFYGKIDGNACKRAAVYINEIKPQKTKVPDVWPVNEFSYETPGTFQRLEWEMGRMDIIQCVGCYNIIYIRPELKLVKCPWCAIALTR